MGRPQRAATAVVEKPRAITQAERDEIRALALSCEESLAQEDLDHARGWQRGEEMAVGQAWKLHKEAEARGDALEAARQYARVQIAQAHIEAARNMHRGAAEQLGRLAARKAEAAERDQRIGLEREQAEQSKGLLHGRPIVGEDLAQRREADRLNRAGMGWPEVAYEMAQRITGKQIKTEAQLRRLSEKIRKRVERARDAGLLTDEPVGTVDGHSVDPS